VITALPRLVASAASAEPDRAAVVDGDGRLTYAELESRANQLSWLLRDLGVRRGDRVGVHMDKSAEAVVGLYGAMKAGAAYVPLDPNAPSARIATIAADCDLRVMVTGVEMAPRWPELAELGAPAASLVVMNGAAGDASFEQVPAGVDACSADAIDGFDGSSPADRGIIDRDLAYILYTSGSTGRPKGVMVSHQNCVAFVRWAAAEFGLGPDDQVSQFAPLIFDLSTFDLFATALAGATVHLVRPQTSLFPKLVHRFLAEREITVMYAVPSLLTMLLERGGLSTGDLAALRTVLFAGEVFPTKHLAALMTLLPHPTYANLYGPTETNVCTYHVVQEIPDPHGPPVSIGRSIADDEGYVVRDDGSLAEVGEEGELWIRGATVMQGYWGDTERTRATLLANPFLPELGDPVYRTGDIVIRQEDDSFTLIGRRDNQVKRRGYRIELGEIESALLAHAAVRECAVTAIAKDGLTEQIVAHVVGPADEQELTAFCLGRIPRYMLPDRIMVWPELPKTPTGKIDRFGLTEHSTTEEDS
jgi:amino acid adenylation domain-containing protein